MELPNTLPEIVEVIAIQNKNIEIYQKNIKESIQKINESTEKIKKIFTSNIVKSPTITIRRIEEIIIN